METLPPRTISEATQLVVTDMAAHTEGPVPEPKSLIPWYGHHAFDGDRYIAQSTTSQSRSNAVDGLNFMKGKSPEDSLMLARPPRYPAITYSSMLNSANVERMGTQGVETHTTRHASPHLPASVVISLPVKVNGEDVETQSFPVSGSLPKSATSVTRLIPSVVSNDEQSDCNTVANPSYIPPEGVIRNTPNPPFRTCPQPVATFTRPANSARTTCPTLDDGNKAVMPECATSAYPPAAGGVTGSLHATETAADARKADSPQEDQQDATNDTQAVVASQEVAATVTSDLDAHSPGSATTVEEIHTPRDGSMPAQTRSKTSQPSSQTPEPSEIGGTLAPGLYGRERNQKRAATKAYRQPITPRTLRSADTKKAGGRASFPPIFSADKSKRAAPAAEGPKEKRPRLSSTAGSTRSRRATHSGDVDERKLQDAQQASSGYSDQPETSLRPFRDVEGDSRYVAQLQEVLQVRGKARKADMGKRQANRIKDLLDLATYPSDKEALFLTKEEAIEAASLGKFFDGPIFTEGQQALQLQTVSEFCDEYYDDDTSVWIQDPEIKPTKKAQIARQVKMGAVKERLAGPESDKPWNCLELATHSDDGLKPSFLNTEDCRLLTKLKIPDVQDKPEARRRAYLPGYKEVEKWALLAQAGALTEPHQDSHGYSTYITINQGQVGFGWLSFPSDDDRAAWRRYPAIFRGGNWRYVVLKPGQTVYFPAGTVHFVFRLPSVGNTLAFGGHVLRCSNIVHWVKTLIEERNAKDVTNEDLTESAPGYLNRVEKFVKQARVTGQEHKWGGEESIREFLRLKEEFLKRKQK